MTEGIEYIYLETHNWGKSVKFWQGLGFELELDLGHSGRLVHPRDGSAVFVEEVPRDRTPSVQIYLRTRDASEKPAPPAEIVAGWQPSHWGSQLLELRDPDGRTHFLQHRPA